jgi:hypothetical protein
MPHLGVLRRPQLAGYAAVALLSAAGALLFFTLILGVHPATWSRPALGLQALAGALALLLTYWYRPPRFFVYPIIIAGVIYLWDTTLPPPTLPEGPLRWLIPRAVLIGLVADAVRTLRRAPRPPEQATRISGGYLTVEGAARVLDTTPADLRLRLWRAMRAPVVSRDGTEYLSLDDLHVVLRHWNESNGWRN